MNTSTKRVKIKDKRHLYKTPFNGFCPMTAYHRFLIRHRIYCERCTDLTRATTIKNVNGKDIALCRKHAGRLADVRKSDQLQEIKA